MPFLAIYMAISIASLFAAFSVGGGAREFFGRVLSLFLSLHWGIVANFFHVQKGAHAGLAIAAGGMP